MLFGLLCLVIIDAGQLIVSVTFREMSYFMTLRKSAGTKWIKGKNNPSRQWVIKVREHLLTLYRRKKMFYLSKLERITNYTIQDDTD